MTEKTRISFYVSNDVKEKVEEYSRKMGVSVSGFLNVLISQRIREDEALDFATLAQKVIEGQAKK